MVSRTPQFTSRLGKVFDRRLNDRCKSRKKWRDATPRPNTAKATLSGTNICQPFSALGLERSELEDVSTERTRPATTSWPGGTRRSRARGASMWGVVRGSVGRVSRPVSGASNISDGPPRIPKLRVVTSSDSVPSARLTSIMATAASGFAGPGQPSGHGHRSKSAAPGARAHSLAALASPGDRHPAPILPGMGGGGRRSGPGALSPTQRVSPKKRGQGPLGGLSVPKAGKAAAPAAPAPAPAAVDTPGIRISSSLPEIRGAK